MIPQSLTDALELGLLGVLLFLVLLPVLVVYWIWKGVTAHDY
jgi:hypothetical protein